MADEGCFTCAEREVHLANGEGDHYPLNECPKSKKPCGHHDDCLWDMDVCHYCGYQTPEEGE